MFRSKLVCAGVMSVVWALSLAAVCPTLGAEEADKSEPAKKERRVKKHRKAHDKEQTMSRGGAASWKIGTQAYTFHKYSLFEAIDKAKELGLKYIEIYPGQSVSPDRPKVKFNHASPLDLRKEVEAKLKADGVQVSSYGVVRINDETEARKVFDFARDMGIETVVSEPDDTPAIWDMLDKITQEYKINLAIHNHPKAPQSHYWDPKTVLNAVKERNTRIGACADIGHWMRSGIDPMEALKMLKGRIIELHFKDLNEASPEGHDMPWGKGKANARALMAELDRQGFSGLFCIEYEHNWMNSMPEIAECIKFFNQVKEELAAEKGRSEASSAKSQEELHWQLAIATYTFKQMTLFEAIDKAKECGVDAIEAFSWMKVSPEHGNMVLDPEMPRPAIGEVKTKLDESKVKLVGYYVKTLGKNEQEDRKMFEFCRKLGIQYVVSEPNKNDIPALDKLAQEYKVKVAIHNHPRKKKDVVYANWHPDSVMRMLDECSEWMGCCADTGHWVRSRLDPIECIKKYKGRLVSLHLKDVHEKGSEGQDVVYGTGVAGLKEVLTEVKNMGFSGTFAIEYESMKPDNLKDVLECVRWFKKTQKELGVK